MRYGEQQGQVLVGLNAVFVCRTARPASDSRDFGLDPPGLCQPWSGASWHSPGAGAHAGPPRYRGRGRRRRGGTGETDRPAWEDGGARPGGLRSRAHGSRRRRDRTRARRSGRTAVGVKRSGRALGRARVSRSGASAHAPIAAARARRDPCRPAGGALAAAHRRPARTPCPRRRAGRGCSPAGSPSRLRRSRRRPWVEMATRKGPLWPREMGPPFLGCGGHRDVAGRSGATGGHVAMSAIAVAPPVARGTPGCVWRS